MPRVQPSRPCAVSEPSGRNTFSHLQLWRLTLCAMGPRENCVEFWGVATSKEGADSVILARGLCVTFLGGACELPSRGRIFPAGKARWEGFGTPQGLAVLHILRRGGRPVLRAGGQAPGMGDVPRRFMSPSPIHLLEDR